MKSHDANDKLTSFDKIAEVTTGLMALLSFILLYILFFIVV